MPTVTVLFRKIPAFVRARRERTRRRRIIAARQTDYRRWRSPDSYPATWGRRLVTAMGLIAGALWVADLGCGMQELRRKLSPAVTYLAMDLNKWTDDTLVCDINAKTLPDDYLALCDVCVMMGVLEYVYEPDWLFARLAEHAEGIVFSYATADTSKADRQGNGWVNAFTADDLFAMLGRTPYRVVQLRFHEDQILVKAVNPDFGHERLALREERRQAFKALVAEAA